MAAQATASSTWRLEMRGISKRYGSVQALREVDFSLRPGEVMALLGENGAGKSTLVKILSGLIKEDEGTISIDGQPADLHTSRRSQAAGVAVVQQEYASVRTMTVAENLVLGREGTSMYWSPGKLRREARATLASVGLAHVDPRVSVAELSVAEMQLLEVARVLARDARIVIFDEPTAALSSSEVDHVLGVVRDLADQGRSVVYVTHRLPEVFRITDRITVFRNGANAGTVETATQDVDSVIGMMLGREMTTLFPDRAPVRGDTMLEVEELAAPGLAAPVSLAVRSGEVLGLVGQLGSGNSALIQAVAGRAAVLGGGVLLGGEPVSLRDRRAGIDAGIAYCSPDRKQDGIFATLSTERNLSAAWLPAITSGGVLSARRERERATGIATAFAMDVRRMSTPVGLLSGGNQQKVALGRWLGTEPRAMLVEEPTRGVDVGARADIYRHLRTWCDAGVAMVVSSSDTAEVLGLCDTIAAFYHGRLVGVRSHEDWSEQELLTALMHGQVA